MYDIVLDTSVFIAALRSRRGASYRLLELAGDDRWRIHISATLALEYEATGKREAGRLGIPAAAIDDIVDMLCRTSRHHAIHFRFCILFNSFAGTSAGSKLQLFKVKYCDDHLSAFFPVYPAIATGSLGSIALLGNVRLPRLAEFIDRCGNGATCRSSDVYESSGPELYALSMVRTKGGIIDAKRIPRRTRDERDSNSARFGLGHLRTNNRW